MNNFSHVKMSSNSYIFFGSHSQEEHSRINEILRNIYELEIQIEKKFNFELIT